MVYDFSRLMRRGKGVAMAQLVNIVGFAVGKLGLGDTVVIHGTEQIDDRVKKYLRDQFDHMHERGGRVVYSYNDVDKMLADSDFNKFDAADYTLFGPMRDRTVAEYQKQLHQQIPPDLAQPSRPRVRTSPTCAGMCRTWSSTSTSRWGSTPSAKPSAGRCAWRPPRPTRRPGWTS